MKSAFIQLSSGDAHVPTRLSLDLPDNNTTSLIMPAYAIGSPYYCVKIVSVNYSNPHKGLPLIHGVVQVFDASKGNHVATLDGESITAIRTAAIAHLAHSTPTNFLFSSTDFNSYVTQSIADDAPQRKNGCLSINQRPGLGITAKMDVLGDPYFTCDSNESVNFFASQEL